MKLRYLILFLVIMFLVGGIPQARAQSTDNVVIDGVNRGLIHSKLRSCSFGVIFQNRYAVLWPSKGTEFYLIQVDEVTKRIKIRKRGTTADPFTVVNFSVSDSKPQLAFGYSNGTILVHGFMDIHEGGLKNARSLKGYNKSNVTAVAFSPDEQTLASGAEDGTIVLWDTVAAKPLFSLPGGHNEAVNTIAFSPDGRYLASGAADGSVKLWDLYKKLKLFSRIEHRGEVRAVAFSPDNKMIASGGEDGLIKLWPISNSNELNGTKKTLDTHQGPVKTIAFSPDGIHLASGGLYGTVFLWNLQNIQNVKEIDIKQAYGSLYEGIKEEIDIQTRVDNINDKTHQNDLLSIVFSSNGRDLLSLSNDCSIKWKLSAIGINPESLIRARKPSPLIEKIKGQDNIPPIVNIPEEVVTVTAETTHYTVSGTATDTLSGISSLTVDGELVPVGKNGKFIKRVENLKEGENEIRIVATDGEGNRKPKILTITRQPAPDTIAPTVEVENPEFEGKNVAVVEYDQEEFQLQVTATDDKSGVNEVRVNGIPAEFQAENGQFIAKVPLTKEETKISVIAEDNIGNKSEAREIAIRRQSAPDITAPTVRVTNAEFEDENVATVEYNQKEFQLRVTATDDKSGVNEVRVNVNSIPAEVQSENGQFIAKVPLTKEENKIRIVAEDNSKNKSKAEEITIWRKPKPIISPIPPPDPVEIEITIPQMESEVEPLRAYGTDKTTFSISGNVIGFESVFPIIKATIKSKTTGRSKKPIPAELSKKTGAFGFEDVSLFPGENEVTLKIDLSSREKAVTKVFLIKSFGSQQLPDRPIQPPGPVAPPTRPIEQKNKPPWLDISHDAEELDVEELDVEERATKGTQEVADNQDDIQEVTDNQDDVHEETEISKQNTDRKKIIPTTKEKVIFKGKVYDDTTTLSDIDLKIGTETVGIQEDGTFKHPYELEYGENQITITATDEDGEKTEEEYTVYHRPDRDGKDFALFFAMEKYDQKAMGWAPLSTPIKDVGIIAEKLEENYGFKTVVFENPDKMKIESELVSYRDEFKDENGDVFKYSDDSQLLIYFSGHGFAKKVPTVTGKEEKLGFIAPIGSVGPALDEKSAESTSISFEDLRKQIDLILSRRILVLVDTCESGLFDPDFREKRGPSNSSSNDPMEKIKVNFSTISRWFMTATSAGSVLDGTRDKTKGSPFATAFLDALDSQGREDHLLELREVSEFIKESKNHPDYGEEGKEVPEPRVGQFKSSESGSNFMFFPLFPLKE